MSVPGHLQVLEALILDDQAQDVKNKSIHPSTRLPPGGLQICMSLITHSLSRFLLEAVCGITLSFELYWTTHIRGCTGSRFIFGNFMNVKRKANYPSVRSGVSGTDNGEVYVNCGRKPLFKINIFKNTNMESVRRNIQKLPVPLNIKTRCFPLKVWHLQCPTSGS